MFQCFDSGSNGIDFPEFEMIGAAINQPEELKQRMELCLMDPNEKLWKDCDTNVDGKISSAEWVACYSPLC